MSNDTLSGEVSMEGGVSDAAPQDWLMSVTDAPTYRPSETEFEDPLRYIASIREEAEQYGICRIVPPASWSNVFALNLDTLRFHTRVQKVHELQKKPLKVQEAPVAAPSPGSGGFKGELESFFKSRPRAKNAKQSMFVSKPGGGRTLRWPTYYSVELDLGKLYTIVQEKGGYEAVTKNKEWRKCSVLLGIVQKGTVSVAYVLRTAYERFLKDYEEWRKAGNAMPTTTSFQHEDAATRNGTGATAICPPAKRRPVRRDIIASSKRKARQQPPRQGGAADVYMGEDSDDDNVSDSGCVSDDECDDNDSVPDTNGNAAVMMAAALEVEEKDAGAGFVQRSATTTLATPPHDNTKREKGYSIGTNGNGVLPSSSSPGAHALNSPCLESIAKGLLHMQQHNDKDGAREQDDDAKKASTSGRMSDSDRRNHEEAPAAKRARQETETREGVEGAAANGVTAADQTHGDGDAAPSKDTLKHDDSSYENEGGVKRERYPVKEEEEEDTPFKLRRRPERAERKNLHIRAETCEFCFGGDHDDKMLLCDRCNRGYHMFCLVPPLLHVPQGEWLCPVCKVSDVVGDEVGFLEGDMYTFDEFKDMADSFAAEYLRNSEDGTNDADGENGTDAGEGDHRMNGDDADENAEIAVVQNEDKKDDAPLDVRSIETLFWDIVEKQEPRVEVSYAADLDTSTFGSGFEKPKKRTTSKWNLNVLPRLTGEHGSLLSHTGEEIPGVIVPWIYFGMLFSSFCWHVEDHMFYSINYHHFGAPKVWYGVPSAAAANFEDVFRKTLPDQFEAQPDLLFHLVTMLSPRVLKEHGVPVYRAVQEPGSFIITFPNGYHGGFDAGVNCAEAVNFAPYDWLRFGHVALARYRRYNIRPPLSHEELILNAAASISAKSSAEARWLSAEMHRIVTSETNARYALFARGLVDSRCLPPGIGLTKSTTVKAPPKSLDADDDDSDSDSDSDDERDKSCDSDGEDDVDDDEEPEALCSLCKSSLYLSGCECDCSPGRAVCLNHVDELCGCSIHKKRFLYRFPLSHLETLKRSIDALVTKEDEEDEIVGSSSKASTTQKARVEEEAFMKQIRDGGEVLDSNAEASDRARDSAQSEQIAAARAWEARASLLLCQGRCVVEDGEGCTKRGSDIAQVRDDVGMQLEDLYRLVRDSRTFAWAGIAVHDVAPSLRIVNDMLHWVNDVMDASECTSEKPIRLRKAEAILQRGFCKVHAKEWPAGEFEGLTLLMNKVAAAQNLGERIDNALCWRLKMKELKALRNDAIVSSIFIPQITTIAEVVKSINAFEYKLRKVLPKSRTSADKKMSKYFRDKKLRYHLSELDDLIRRAQDLPVLHKRYMELCDAANDVKQWQLRARLLLSKMQSDGSTKLPTFVELQLLNYQAEDFKVYVDEMIDVEQRVSNAEQWLTEVEQIMDSLPRVDIGHIDDLIARGAAMPLMIPEVETLRNHVSVRKWADFKKTTLRTRASAAEIAEVLARGEALPERPPEVELERLRNRLREAEEWQARVSRVLPRDTDSHALHAEADPSVKISMAELSSIVGAGNKIAVRLDELPRLTEMLNRAQHWVGQANAVLRQRVATSTRHAQVETSAGLTLRQVEAMIDEATNLDVIVSEVDALRALLSSVDEWSARALQELKAPNLGSWDTCAEENNAYCAVLQSIVDEGRSFGLVLDPLKQLSSKLDALDWEIEANRMLKSLQSDAAAASTTTHDTAKKPQSAPKDRDIIFSMQDLVEHRRAWNGIVVSDSRVAEQLDVQLSTCEHWEKRARRLIEKKKGAREDEVDSERRVIHDLEKFTSLLAEVEDLRLVYPSAVVLRDIVDAHAVWERKATRLLEQCASESAAGRCETMPVAFTTTGQTVSRPRDRVALDKWKALLEEGSSQHPDILIRSTTRTRIEAMVSAATKWIDRCRRTVVRRGGVSDSAEAILKLILATTTRSNQDASTMSDDETPMCFCQMTALENDSSMVCCDTCDEWFHLRCAGVSKAAEKKLQNFECVVCQAMRGKFDGLAAKLSDYKKYQTSRPSYDTLLELIESESELESSTVAGDILWQIASAVADFDRRCRDARDAYCAHVEESAGKVTSSRAAAQEAEVRKDDPPPVVATYEKGTADKESNGNGHASNGHISNGNGHAMHASAEHVLEQTPIEAAKAMEGDNNNNVNDNNDKDDDDAQPETETDTAVSEARQCLKAAFALEVHCPTIETMMVRTLFVDAWERTLRAMWPDDSSNGGGVPVRDHGADSAAGQQYGICVPCTVNGTAAAPAITAASTPALPTLADVQMLLGAADALCFFRPSRPSEAPSPSEEVERTEKKKKMGASPSETSTVSSSARALYDDVLSKSGEVDAWFARFASIEERADSASVEEIRALIAQSASLPLTVPDMDQNIELLEEMCIEYCVCRSRYNPLRPMIACDDCDGWFHYECVGLEVAKEGDEGTPDGQEVGYICPMCHAKKEELSAAAAAAAAAVDGATADADPLMTEDEGCDGTAGGGGGDHDIVVGIASD